MCKRLSDYEVADAANHIGSGHYQYRLVAECDRARRAEEALEAKLAVASAHIAMLEVDNAELLLDLREMVELARATTEHAPACACLPCSRGRLLLTREHPGADLLSEHAKTLVRARNEGLEKAAKQADMMERAAIQVAIGSMAAPVAAGEAHVMGRAARQVANAIRDLKEPES